MTPLDDRPNHNSPNGSQNSNPFEDLIFSICAAIALALWGLTTKRLLLGTYRISRTFNDQEVRQTNVLNTSIGTALALIAGIAVGYNLGWIDNQSFWHWALWSLAASAVTAVYIWTTVYMLGARYAFKGSRRLWSYVNIDAQSLPYYARRNGKYNPAWLSKLLLFLARAALIIASLDAIYLVACHIQAHQHGWNWLGQLCSIVVPLLLFVAMIAALRLIASFSGWLVFWLLVSGVIAYFYYQKICNAFALGFYHNLTGGAWGPWGYVPGAVAGLVFAGIVGGGLWYALSNLRIRLIAGAASIAATWYFAAATNRVVSIIPLGHFGLIAPALPWFAYALESFILGGFVFPIVHIIISHGIPKLNIFQLARKTYKEPRGGYREFFLQALNIIATAWVIWFGPELLRAHSGYSSPWIIYPLTGAAALFSYVALGSILDITGVWIFGAAVSTYGGFRAFALYEAHYKLFGWWGALAAAIIGTLACFYLLFPVAYLILRWLLDRRWLAQAARNKLVDTHERVCDALWTVWDELFEAADKTYRDRTPYREVAVHLLNFVVALAVLSGSFWYAQRLGLPTWLSAPIAVILTMTSFGLVGKALLRWGMRPVGFLLGSIAGVLLGVAIHGGQPAHWGGYRYILSFFGGLFGAAMMYSVIFPWLYVFMRAGINETDPETWLRPALIGFYERYSSFFGRFRTKFLYKYRLFQSRLEQARTRFEQRYAQFQQRLNRRT